jgi:hypothetical protein
VLPFQKNAKFTVTGEPELLRQTQDGRAGHIAPVSQMINSQLIARVFVIHDVSQNV